MADDFTEQEKREAAEQIEPQSWLEDTALDTVVKTSLAIDLQCRVNRLTREVGEARGLLDVFVWCAEKDKSAKWFVAVEHGQEWLARNGGAK